VTPLVVLDDTAPRHRSFRRLPAGFRSTENYRANRDTKRNTHRRCTPRIPPSDARVANIECDRVGVNDDNDDDGAVAMRMIMTMIVVVHWEDSAIATRRLPRRFRRRPTNQTNATPWPPPSFRGPTSRYGLSLPSAAAAAAAAVVVEIAMAAIRPRLGAAPWADRSTIVAIPIIVIKWESGRRTVGRNGAMLRPHVAPAKRNPRSIVEWHRLVVVVVVGLVVVVDAAGRR